MALLCTALAKPHDNKKVHQNFSRYAKEWEENNGVHGRTLFYVRIQTQQHTHTRGGGMGFIM